MPGAGTHHERAALFCAHGAQPRLPNHSSQTLRRHTRLVALLTTAILSALGLVHIYWALGGRSGSGAAVPELSGRPASSTVAPRYSRGSDSVCLQRRCSSRPPADF